MALLSGVDLFIFDLNSPFSKDALDLIILAKYIVLFECRKIRLLDHSLLILSFPKCTQKLIHCSCLPLLLHYTHYFIQNYLHFSKNLAFLSHFLHPFFIAWVTLFSFFPSLNALRHLSIVLFTPFYCLIRPVLHKLAYISIKTLHSFLISFATTMRRISRRRIFLRQIFRIPFCLAY